MSSQNKDRRKNVSFKDTNRDKTLLDWANSKSIECSGFSAYIKTLIQKDMEGYINDANKSR